MRNPTLENFFIMKTLLVVIVGQNSSKVFCCLLAQLYLTLVTPWTPPVSSVHGISQARILEWVAISFSRGSSNPGVEPASLALAGS